MTKHIKDTMKTYEVSWLHTVSITRKYEAESMQQAIEMAQDNPAPLLGDNVSKGVYDDFEAEYIEGGYI